MAEEIQYDATCFWCGGTVMSDHDFCRHCGSDLVNKKPREYVEAEKESGRA